MHPITEKIKTSIIIIIIIIYNHYHLHVKCVIQTDPEQNILKEGEFIFDILSAGCKK